MAWRGHGIGQGGDARCQFRGVCVWWRSGGAEVPHCTMLSLPGASQSSVTRSVVCVKHGNEKARSRKPSKI
ncbi:hypothetical protein Pmani_008884 [Petrolisthes manimaculis]|uniref:Uncharacterized protein n=1 Tax=Petrolisthes manimaculis TaxID=1843537 RepID=A0AAE1Q5P3_9EUCA|nr:hypothetical protein Pmani_008884 [Petrolisthes manimaculis]